MNDDPPPLPYASPLRYTAPALNAIDAKLLWALAILHWAFAVFYVIVVIKPLGGVVFGLQLIFSGIPSNPPGQAADAGWWLVACCGASLVPFWLLAGLTLFSGIQIVRRRYRRFSIVVAGLNCVLFPFGTALGIFTLIVLLRRSVETLYRLTAE